METNKTRPKTVLPTKLDFPEVSISKLPNDIEVKSLYNYESQISKLVLYIDAGNLHEEKHLVAPISGQMMNEGTKKLSSRDLQEQMEYLGASFHVSSNIFYTTVNLSALQDNMFPALDLLKQVLTDANFPQKEFEIIISQNKKNVENRDENIAAFATEAMNEIMYGTNSPIGYITQLSNYDLLAREDVQNFYDQFITSTRSTLFLSGNYNDKLIEKVQETLGSGWSKNNSKSQPELIKNPSKERFKRIERKSSKQVAIMQAKESIHVSHPDYAKLSFANYILGGGSLGSRLNKNLRIDKGYTYGAYSSFHMYPNFSRWFIKGEFKKESEKDVLNQIKIEVDKLQNTLVTNEELEITKNRIIGGMLENFDGPFSLAGTLISLHRDGLDWDYYHNYMNMINSVTPEEIREMAQKYFSLDDAYTVICG